MTDDLTTLHGVGPTIAEALHEAGYETPEEVLEASVDELTDVEYIGESSAEGIVEQDPDATRGRDSYIDEVWDDVMEAAEDGLTYEGIARVAGIGRETLDGWRRNNEEFNRELEQRRSVAERRIINFVEETRPEFLLERSFGYTKEQDINLDADVDADHDVTADFVTYTVDEDGDDTDGSE